MRIVLVDDDQYVADALAYVLRDAGHEVSLFSAPASAMAQMNAAPADIVVSDVRLAGADGIAFIRQVRGAFPKAPIIAISGGGGGAETLEDARRAGADVSLQKPFTGRTLLSEIEKLAASRHG